jgi:cyclopropane fatty-acyl-phospholipid synthase-like methyltransferase
MPVQDATWQEIWDRKGARAVADYDLETLLDLDGYDVGAGSLGPDDFQSVVDLVVDKLELKAGMRVLEVGCGAGALLWCLRDRGLELSGIDFSAPLIEHARAAIPEAEFRVAEAVDVDGEADAIVCCGVFHYFPDYDYAKRVVDGFMRTAPVALVMDVPDLATRETSEEARREAGSKPGEHLYYPRSFFGESATTMQSEVPGYRNAPFRFHALVSR